MKAFQSIILCITVLSAVSACRNGDVVQNPVIIDKALNDSASAFYGHFDKYPEDMKELPIGVFDSGTGGLTVLERLLELDYFNNHTFDAASDSIPDFAGERFIYLADQANMPYGVYDACGKADYLRELVVKDALFLMGNRYYASAGETEPSGSKERVKIMVIGCNTATAYGLGHIQSMLEQSGTGVKVIGVINAGVNATLDLLSTEKDSYAIGVLATQGTISSNAYEQTIRNEAASRGIKQEITVVNQSGYGFAESVDSEPDYVNTSLHSPRDSYRGPRFGNGDADIKRHLMPVYNFETDGNSVLTTMEPDGEYTDFQLNDAANYARFNLVSLVERHRESGSKVPLKAIILGCTHYPFLISTLSQVIDELRNYESEGSYPYRDIISEDLCFIDPAVYTAVECFSILKEDGNLCLRTVPTKVDAYISVPSADLPSCNLTGDGALTYDFKYGRETGTENITTKQVPFSTENIDAGNLARIRQILPHTYGCLRLHD